LVRQDFRYSLRSLSRQPGFVAAVVLSLALGIGVNTAIFSALNALLWRPLALRDLDRTVVVFHADASHSDRGTSYRAYQHYRARTDMFSKVMAFSGSRPMILSDGDRRDQIYAELVTPDYFSMSEIDVPLGRGFDSEADRTLAPQFVVVLSHAFWQRRFASDPGVVGKTVMLNSRPFAVIGVGRQGFTGFDVEVSADAWIPLTTWAQIVGEPGRLTGDEHWLTTVAQLAPGVTTEQARQAMVAASQSLPGSPPGQQTRIRPARQRFAELPTEVLALGAGAFAVGLLVLTLACTNVTNLLMARAAARQKEMSVRLTLGSGRLRLIRLWLTETVLLCAAAGALGLVLATWLLDLVVAFRPPTAIGESQAPILPFTFRLDVRSLAFTFGISMLTALAVGFMAGFPGSKAGGRRFAPGFNLRSAVIALQMALSLILLIPCGLFVRSWLNAFTISPGFDTDHVLLLPIAANQAGVRVAKPAGFDQDLADRVDLLPEVDSATLMDPVPLWFGGSFSSFAREDEPGVRQRLGVSRVGTRYFQTLRIRLLIGRDFTPADDASAPPVAIVNETLARMFWPDGNAVGRRLRSPDASIEVIGVASDSKYLSLAETSRPWLYRPLPQYPSNNLTLSLALRTVGDPMRSRAAVEREVKALVPGWPAFQFRTLEEGLALQQTVPRMGATLLGVLGLLSLLLAAVGISGVMSYVVKQRTREIGIRLAIGAPARRVLTLLIRQGMAVCLAGAAIGVGIALVVSPFLSDVLYNVSAADPLVFIGAPLVLFAIALLACYMPARHAAGLNALDALRYE
jgi:predicted permease